MKVAKVLLFTSIALLALLTSCSKDDDSPSDSSDNLSKVNIPVIGDYKTVTINGKIWMAENLRYKPTTTKSIIPEGYVSVEGNDAELNPTLYGLLYTYEKATEIADAINGWRLPTENELQALVTTDENIVKSYIHPESWYGWLNGENVFEFNYPLNHPEEFNSTGYSFAAAGFALSLTSSTLSFTLSLTSLTLSLMSSIPRVVSASISMPIV